MIAPLSNRDCAAILAGLRLWQAERESAATGIPISAVDVGEIASDGGAFEPLSAREIDALCERLNTAHVLVASDDDLRGLYPDIPEKDLHNARRYFCERCGREAGPDDYTWCCGYRLCDGCSGSGQCPICLAMTVPPLEGEQTS